MTLYGVIKSSHLEPTESKENFERTFIADWPRDLEKAESLKIFSIAEDNSDSNPSIYNNPSRPSVISSFGPVSQSVLITGTPCAIASGSIRKTFKTRVHHICFGTIIPICNISHSPKKVNTIF